MTSSRQLSACTNITVQYARDYQSDSDDEVEIRTERSNTVASTPTLDSTLAQGSQVLTNMQGSSHGNFASSTTGVNNTSTNGSAADQRKWQEKFWTWFMRIHFKNWQKNCITLIVFRILSIVGLIAYTIIDTIMYSSSEVNKPLVLQFLHGSRYLALEIFTIIYASGVAIFGISVEIYLLVPYILCTLALAARSCDGPIVVTHIFWILKVVFLLIAIEVVHYNFRRFRDYTNKFESSSRALLRQALIFSVTMLFLSAPGLRTLYNAVNTYPPLLCPYDTSHCGIVDLYVPKFTSDNDGCLDGLKEYVSGREQLRVLRNYALLNGVSYAIFNQNFLFIEHSKRYFTVRVLLVFLYVGLVTSVLVAHVDTLYFIEKCRIPYNIIELAIFIILFALPTVNLLVVYIQRQDTVPSNRISAAFVNVVRRLAPPENEALANDDMHSFPTVLPS